MARKYSPHIRSTAQAWNISLKRTKNLYNWVGSKVPKERQGQVFAIMLKRYQDSKSNEE